jgi:hypothetical protein
MSDHEAYVRVLLHLNVTEEQLEELALDLDWMPKGLRAATDKAPYQHVFQDETAGVYIHYVWDELLRIPYVLLRGDDVAAVEEKIRRSLPTYTYDEVVEHLRSASGRESVIDAICQVALLRSAEDRDSAEDPEIVELLRRERQSDDVEIRRAVVTCAGYLEWPALLALITEVREIDSNETVRQDATLVLDAIAESNETGRGRPCESHDD